VRPRPPGVDAPPPRAGVILRRILTHLSPLLCTLCLAGSCPPTFDPIGRVNPLTLPEDGLECLRLADAWSQPGTPKEKKLDALVALDRAQDLHADAYVGHVIRARVYFRLVEEFEGDAEADRWLELGIAAARAAVAANGDRVEGHYYLATLVGRQAERATVGALDMIPQIQAELERCVELDKTYDHCGPLVGLGTLYMAAPPWPQSIGDPETGIDYLRQSVSCSDYPVNAIMLAQSLLDQGEYDEARDLLREAMAAPARGDWAVAGNRWRPIARDLLDQAEHPGGSGR
jgi:tetratricopeptide (TPR) repeat protein